MRTPLFALLGVGIAVGTTWIWNRQSIPKRQMPVEPFGLVRHCGLKPEHIRISDAAAGVHAYQSVGEVLQPLFFGIGAIKFLNVDLEDILTSIRWQEARCVTKMSLASVEAIWNRENISSSRANQIRPYRGYMGWRSPRIRGGEMKLVRLLRIWSLNAYHYPRSFGLDDGLGVQVGSVSGLSSFYQTMPHTGGHLVQGFLVFRHDPPLENSYVREGTRRHCEDDSSEEEQDSSTRSDIFRTKLAERFMICSALAFGILPLVVFCCEVVHNNRSALYIIAGYFSLLILGIWLVACTVFVPSSLNWWL